MLGNGNYADLTGQMEDVFDSKIQQIPIATTDYVEERIQEINSLCRINDSFKKFVVIKDNIEPWQDDKGILYIGIEQFLLEEDWLR